VWRETELTQMTSCSVDVYSDICRCYATKTSELIEPR